MVGLGPIGANITWLGTQSFSLCHGWAKPSHDTKATIVPQQGNGRKPTRQRPHAGGIAMMAQSAIDIALWDIVGKAAYHAVSRPQHADEAAQRPQRMGARQA